MREFEEKAGLGEDEKAATAYDWSRIQAPHTGSRAPLIASMLLAIVASVLGSISLWSDVQYFFSERSVFHVSNDAELRAHDSAEPSNRYALVQGNLLLSRALRVKTAFGGRSYEVYPLAERPDVLVQVPVSVSARGDSAQLSLSRAYSGRLRRVSELGFASRSAKVLLSSMTQSPEVYVLAATETPDAMLSSVFLFVLFASVALVDAMMLVYWFAPLKSPVRTPIRSMAI